MPWFQHLRFCFGEVFWAESARGAFESVTAQLAELVLEDSGDVCTREERWPPGVLSVVAAAAACNFISWGSIMNVLDR